MSDEKVLFNEVQRYRELPPVVVISLASALIGWGLLIWTVLLGRPLGALELPRWFAIVFGLALGVVGPVMFLRARMVTQVTADRVLLNSGLSGNHAFALRDVVAVDLRASDLRGDYSNRNVGTKDNTRVAYAVGALQGAQLTMRDGRFILIGSKVPEELTQAIDTAWQAITIPS